jgi:hypothetical protein
VSADIGTDPALGKWTVVDVLHGTFGQVATRRLAIFTCTPDFCATCAETFPDWEPNAETLPAPVRTAGEVLGAALVKAADLEVEKAAAKPAPKAKAVKVPKPRAPRKAAKPASATVVEEVEVVGIKARNTLAPEGAKAPYTVQDAAGIYQAIDWRKAKSLALTGAAQPSCSIFDSTGRLVAKSDGKTIETFAAPADTATDAA